MFVSMFVSISIHVSVQIFGNNLVIIIDVHVTVAQSFAAHNYWQDVIDEGYRKGVFPGH
jgi:hypothetical protein